MNQRHWKHPRWDMAELIADILVAQGYAKRKMTAGWIAPAAGGLNQIVDPFYSSDASDVIVTDSAQIHEICQELYARKQADAVEDWLHANRKDLLQFCKSNLIGHSVPYNGAQKRSTRIKWCLEKLLKEQA